VVHRRRRRVRARSLVALRVGRAGRSDRRARPAPRHPSSARPSRGDRRPRRPTPARRRSALVAARPIWYARVPLPARHRPAAVHPPAAIVQRVQGDGALGPGGRGHGQRETIPASSRRKTDQERLHRRPRGGPEAGRGARAAEGRYTARCRTAGCPGARLGAPLLLHHRCSGSSSSGGWAAPRAASCRSPEPAKVFAEDDVKVTLRRRRRGRRGRARAARDRRVPEDAGEVHERSAAASRRACCSSARPAPARRCWRVPWPARPRCPSSASAARSSSRCSSASAPRACATCSSRPSQAVAVHRLHRRARRARQGARAEPDGQPRGARADAEPALAEMDGFDARKAVIIMGATNRPEVLDPALLRPGRFDRQVLVDKPDVKGREAILRIHVKQVKLAPEVDLRCIAARTAGFAGADLANLVNEAALLAARRDKAARRPARLRRGDRPPDRGPREEARDERPRAPHRRLSRVGPRHRGHVLPGLDPVHKISIVASGGSARSATPCSCRSRTGT
jgi:hypothetical protein